MKQIRISLGLTQEKTADMLNLSTQHYGRLERGERFPSLPQLASIANVFNTTIEALLAGSSFRMHSSSACSSDHFSTIISFLGLGCSPSAKALMIDICQMIAARDKQLDL